MSDEKKPKRFDLGKLDKSEPAEEGRVFEVCDPDTGEPTGIEIVLRGTDSATHKRCMRKLVSKYQLMQRTKLTPEQIEADDIELMAACTVSWKGIDLDGVEFMFSRENAIALYTRFDWLKEAVKSFIGNRSNYRRD